MHPVKLLERAASTAAHTVRHPISSAAYAAGIARGLAGAAIHGVGELRGTSSSDRSVPEPRQSEPRQSETVARTTATPGPRKPERVPKPVPPPVAPEDVTVIEPGPPHESFATEPKASSRNSARGGPGHDAELDDWAAEVADEPDIGIETPVGTTGAAAGFNPDTAEADLQQPGTEPLVGDATVKAVASELEVAQAAAAVHKAAEKAAAKKTTAKKTPAKKAPAKKSSTAKKS